MSFLILTKSYICGWNQANVVYSLSRSVVCTGWDTSNIHFNKKKHRVRHITHILFILSLSWLELTKTSWSFSHASSKSDPTKFFFPHLFIQFGIWKVQAILVNSTQLDLLLLRLEKHIVLRLYWNSQPKSLIYNSNYRVFVKAWWFRLCLINPKKSL